MANYRAPCTITRFRYHYSKTNKNLPSVVEKKLQSCKIQSHMGACKKWHIQPGMCKLWHRQSNRVLTCVTLKIKTFRPINKCHVSWRKSLQAPLIRLHHVLLTHPQTPINRSLPEAFQKDILGDILEQTPRHPCQK